MASYQMPQFLDSGDKILGPLNLRQFGYALGGFMFAMIVYYVTSGIFPRLGVLAWGPSIPVVALAAYLALGKFNGRDTDIYAYKYLLYVLKPKFMTYQRFPFVDDLNEKLAEYTVEKINKRWMANVTSKQNISQNDYLAFTASDSELKADTIRRIGSSLDENYTNSTGDFYRQQLIIDQKEALIESYKHPKKPQTPSTGQNQPVLTPNSLDLDNPNEHNFFE